MQMGNMQMGNMAMMQLSDDLTRIDQSSSQEGQSLMQPVLTIMATGYNGH